MTFGLIGNISKPAILDVANNLLAYLRGHQLSFVVHDDLAAWLNSSRLTPPIPAETAVSEGDLPTRCSMVIALGGDGTMLAAARIVGKSQIPILGINLGKLGFLAEVSIDEVGGTMDDIVRGEYALEDRMVLMATVSGATTTYFALNDIVIDRGSSARVIELETSVNTEYLVTYSGDGLVVTTPTGSTAYSLASGGPIVTPGSEVITITPISPHTLTARPVIVPGGSTIAVTMNTPSKPVHITADGQIEGVYTAPVEFSIRKAPYVVRLVKRRHRTYFDLLRAKLLWGRDLRIQDGKQ